MIALSAHVFMLQFIHVTHVCTQRLVITEASISVSSQKIDTALMSGHYGAGDMRCSMKTTLPQSYGGKILNST